MSEDRPFELPAEIVIPTPSHSVLIPRGLSAGGKKMDPHRGFRMSDEHMDAIRDACALVGCSASEFVRWTTYIAANRLIAMYHLYCKDPEKYFKENRTVAIQPFQKVERRRIRMQKSTPMSAVKIKNPYEK